MGVYTVGVKNNGPSWRELAVKQGELLNKDMQGYLVLRQNVISIRM